MVREYFLTLAACNTVVPIRVDDDDDDVITTTLSSGDLGTEISALGSAHGFSIEYQSESPDEQALVSAAASYGFRLLSRSSNYLVINVLGETQK
jgi:phospholipid-transporting ATPase